MFIMVFLEPLTLQKFTAVCFSVKTTTEQIFINSLTRSATNATLTPTRMIASPIFAVIIHYSNARYLH